MATIIPTDSSSASYFLTMDFGGRDFTFLFTFNARANFWFFSLFDPSGNEIVTGRKIVTGFPLLRTIKSANRPAGELFAIDTTGAGTEAGFSDLGEGKIVRLVYVEEADL